ncbi:MAG TPA: hypothetical protein VN631_02360, partial [Negativicutes bacterium]|nr:hypothetical protein [Negativicutes bacterium]
MNIRGKFTMWVLGVAVLASGLWGIGTQAAEAAIPPLAAEPSSILDYLITNVPEIQEMARKNPANRLVMSVEAAPDPQAAERMEREFYRIYVGFNVQDGGSGHQSRWATFLVNKDKTEILWANYLTTNSYVPLSDWRKYVNVPPAPGVNDWMCIPFLRVGPIRPSSSIDDLVRLFGLENVRQQTVYGAEGTEKYETSVIFPETPNQVIVFWQDNQYGTVPSSVSIRQQGSAWKTVQGIQIGTTLAELNAINGRPFSFFGFGWDYGGSVHVQWNGGTMASIRGLFLVLRETRDLPRQYYG